MVGRVGLFSTLKYHYVRSDLVVNKLEFLVCTGEIDKHCVKICADVYQRSTMANLRVGSAAWHGVTMFKEQEIKFIGGGGE